MTRIKTPKNIETQVLISSRRRCSLCTGIDRNYSEQIGQIAHLDHNNSNNSLENLCFLCLKHHSLYDTKTSQHKNYTILEVKSYRQDLYSKLLREGDRIDRLEPSKISDTKPYALSFNGLNGFVQFDPIPLTIKSEIIVETEFRIHNQLYAGVLFNLLNRSKEYFLYTKHYSKEHPSKPSFLELCYKKGKKEIAIFSIQKNYTKWNRLILKISSQTLSLTINDVEIIESINSVLKQDIDRIEIGGTRWENEKYDKSKPIPSYLSSYFRYFRIFSDGEIISNMEFSYGQTYFNKINFSQIKRYGGASFLKIIK